MAAFRSADSTAPAHGAIAVSPNDSTVFAMCRGLYIGTAGHVVVRMADGHNATFSNVPVGVLPVQVDMVLSTGTGASNIVALY